MAVFLFPRRAGAGSRLRGRRYPLEVVPPPRGSIMSRSRVTARRTFPTADTTTPTGPRPYFLIVDDRFRVPIFVFVELEPRRPARAVTIEFASLQAGRGRCCVGVGPATSLGRHP